ncbi:hypothetical protein [Synechococcus sp. M16CYN]|uniref:hypothetical protein n=1 Tax=Synechococcus sp. M16CYN TaxID=3103139 RepID=UPI0030E0A282
MKRKYFIHVGHGKTGTTAIQSSLALASNQLKELGVLYPIEEEARQKASLLEITSGNCDPKTGHDLRQTIKQLEHKLHKNTRYKKVILSSENLFFFLDDFIDHYEEISDLIEVEIILAVREIEEMLSSEYQQLVKRHGEYRSFNTFVKVIRQYISSHHKLAAELIRKLDTKKIKINLINYSYERNLIAQKIFKSIGIIDVYPKKSVHDMKINRSLSKRELEIIIIINTLFHSYIPEIGRYITDKLIKQYPQEKVHQCALSQDNSKYVFQINQPFLIIINRLLPDGQKLQTNASKNLNSCQDIRPENSDYISDEIVNLITKITYDTIIDSKKNFETLSNKAIDQIILASKNNKLPIAFKVELLKLAIKYRSDRPQLVGLLNEENNKTFKEKNNY